MTTPHTRVTRIFRPATRRSEEISAPITRSQNQGGRGQRAGPLRSRPEEEPDGGSCGASGAAPRDGTVSQDLVPRNEDRNPSLEEIVSRPTGVSNTRDARMRWTEEDNVLILRVHYIATDMQQRTGRRYRELLTEVWNDINPRRQSYANLLANRVRWLLEKEKFSTTELNSIKQSYLPRIDSENRGEDEEVPLESRTIIRMSIQPSRIERIFNRNLHNYTGISPQYRPKIPRMYGSKRMLECVRRVDRLMERYLDVNITLRGIVDCVYAGAVTVAEELGMKIGEIYSELRQESTPPWKLRLEKKVKNIRKKIGILHTYLNTESHTKKILKGIRQIASESRIRTSRSNEQLKEKLMVVCDRLKQKVKALGNRIKRYNERVKRYKNNHLYYKNQSKFFRNLEATETAKGVYPDEKDMHKAWSEIWERKKMHDDRAFWIKDAEKEKNTYSMDNIEITKEDIKSVLKKANNWAAPGADKLQNYWWKNFTSTHQRLVVLFQGALSDPSTIPEFFTLGLTYMLPKGNITPDPKQYRPITCLPTVYKILTGILTKHLWKHVNKFNILASEQNGCRRDAQGCKELLTIDYLITKQAKKKLRNLSIAWIDYKKAFDSVPHSWLLKVLRLYGVSEQFVGLLEHMMTTWRTKLVFGTKTTSEIKILTGIFQGDKLSALWFCLALNFLSKLLNNNSYGYIIDNEANIKITHQLYVDDLKLYATNEEQLRRLLRTVTAFSQTIGMEMGLDKCAVVHVKRGKLTHGGEMLVQDELAIQRLGPEESYRYLGLQQALEIRTADEKISFKKKFFDRVKKVLRSKLNAKALFTAINTWAVPSIAYSFGVIRWSNTDLKAIDKQVRVLLSKHGMHHPHASTWHAK